MEIIRFDKTKCNKGAQEIVENKKKSQGNHLFKNIGSMLRRQNINIGGRRWYRALK